MTDYPARGTPVPGKSADPQGLDDALAAVPDRRLVPQVPAGHHEAVAATRHRAVHDHGPVRGQVEPDGRPPATVNRSVSPAGASIPPVAPSGGGATRTSTESLPPTALGETSMQESAIVGQSPNRQPGGGTKLSRPSRVATRGAVTAIPPAGRRLTGMPSATRTDGCGVVSVSCRGAAQTAARTAPGPSRAAAANPENNAAAHGAHRIPAFCLA